MSENKDWIIELGASGLSIDLIGGKAVNLCKMIGAGLPVPGGFVVTTEAFKGCPDGKVSSSLREHIVEAWKALDWSGCVAVRSSATAEDLGDASMAGQYETFLNVSSLDGVLEAVENCWKSLRTPRTEAYLKEQGIDPAGVAMAVVVQKQVAAESAGVLFTVDPKSGERDEMVVEAVWGLGEGLVSGDVQPDLIRLQKQKLAVLDYQVARKEQALFVGDAGITAVDAALQEKACIDYAAIEQLHALGLRAEAYFGSPQDLEWALQDGTVHLLQSRAITTLQEVDAYNAALAAAKTQLNQRVGAGSELWVRHNLGETLPHPTPLTWSIIAPFMSGSGGFGKLYEELGFHPGPKVRGRSFLERIAGEIYMDCELMTEMFSEGYAFTYDAQTLRSNPDAAQQPPSLPRGDLKSQGAAAQLAQSATSRILDLAKDLDRKFEEILVPELLAWCKTQEADSLDELSDEALASRWEAQVEKVLGDFGHRAFLPSMVEAVAVSRLRTALSEHAWRHNTDSLLEMLSVSRVPDKTLSTSIDRDKVDDATWWESYGHRATSEFELASPRWHETPEVISTIHAGKLAQVHERRIAKADQAMGLLKEELNPGAFSAVSEAADLVQRYLRFREDGKFFLMRAYAQLRRTALEFGKRLKLGDSVFQLDQAEMLEALKTGFVPQDRVAARALTYRVEKRISLPHVIEKADIPTLGKATALDDGDALKVFSVSNGSATGKACIVHSPSEADHFEDGDILVCPSTDPSWTPLFARASGLVLEKGGSLSHGAVVAREMGLPAGVLGTATQALKSGERLTLQADSGTLYRGDTGATSEPQEDLSSLEPPAPGAKEGAANRLGLYGGIFWSVILIAFFLLPPNLFKEPVFSLFDAMLWPLIRQFGMIGAVAVIGGFFGVFPIILQRFITDNNRILEAKMRSSAIRAKMADMTEGSAQWIQLQQWAAPTTGRILKASMVPLALILGPMIMLFMWFPTRVDPLSWNADPGRLVSVVAEVDGEFSEAINLTVTEPLSLGSEASQTLLPIREELLELRAEWRQKSDLSSYPWEIQSAGDHARLALVSSLNAYLDAGVPPQKVSWLIDVPEDAHGSFPAYIQLGEQEPFAFDLVFGTSVAPQPSIFAAVSKDLPNLTVNYPRSLQKKSFLKIPGLVYDIGWLGVYLLVYLPIMFIAKAILRVP